MTTVENRNEIPEVDKDWWKIWKNRRYILTLMCFFGIFNMYICRTNMSVAIVAMSKDITENNVTRVADFHWTSEEKGIILSCFFYGYAIVQVPAGVLVKKISSHIVFGIGTAVPGVLTVLTPLVATHLPFWMLVVTRIVMGLFQGVLVPCMMSFWVTWGPPLERARMHGIALAGAFIGTVVAFPMFGILGKYLGWESIFYTSGTICLIWYIFWLLLIKESPEKDPFISKFELDYIKQSIQKQSIGNPTVIPWSSILTSPSVWAVMCAGFCWGWGYVMMLTQLPSFLSDIMNYDLGKSGFLSSLPYLTMSIMSLLAGYIADQLLVRQLMTALQVRRLFISVILIIQAIFIFIAAYISHPIWNIVCISIGIGLGAISISGISLNYIDVAASFAPILGGLGNTCTTIPGILSPLITGSIVKVRKKARPN